MDQSLNPAEGSIVMPSGYTLSWRTNAAGGRTYYSDECGLEAEVWDTCLTNMHTLLCAMAHEMALQVAEHREAGA